MLANINQQIRESRYIGEGTEALRNAAEAAKRAAADFGASNSRDGGVQRGAASGSGDHRGDYLHVDEHGAEHESNSTDAVGFEPDVSRDNRSSKTSRAAIENAAESVSSGLSRQLTSSLNKEIRPVVNAAFDRVKTDVESAADKAVERLAAERRRHSEQLEEMRKLHQEQAALVEKIEKQTARSRDFALWVLTGCITGFTAVAVLGFFGHGLLSVLGIPAGMGWLWGQVFGASSWYAGLGWFIVALVSLGAVLWALFALVVRLWQAVDGVAMYMDKRRE